MKFGPSNVYILQLSVPSQCLTSLKLIWQAEIEFPGKDFAELIAYCANKCRTTSTNLSGTLRSHLEKLITHFDQVSYLCGFLLSNFISGPLFSFVVW